MEINFMEKNIMGVVISKENSRIIKNIREKKKRINMEN